jgi:hypothetical protein
MISSFGSDCRYISSDCDSVDVLYNKQHYTKTPEEAAAITIKSGSFVGPSQNTAETVYASQMKYR